jgi:cell division protease FtsH
MVFHDPTTGASNDIEKATQLARAMVMQYGMSDKVGAVRLGEGEGEIFLGRDMGHKRDYSEQMAEVIDGEVRTFLETAHQEAYEILSENRDVLDRLVVELLDRETLDQKEVAEIFSDIRKRDYREIWLSSTDRPVSDRGPVRSRKELASENGHAANGSVSGEVPAAGETAGGQSESAE